MPEPFGRIRGEEGVAGCRLREKAGLNEMKRRFPDVGDAVPHGRPADGINRRRESLVHPVAARYRRTEPLQGSA